MYTGDLRFDLFINALWMGWNLLLAAIPFVLALYLFQQHKRISLSWSLGFGVFFLFLPNAPYVLTDLVHLSRVLPELSSRKELVLWTGQFSLFLLVGFILFYESVRRLEKFLLRKKYLKYQPFFRLGTFFVVSTGVYIGRFLRFNSWDLFTQPRLVLNSFRYLNDIPVILFVISFTIGLFALYFLFEKFTQRLHEPLALH